MPNPYVNRVVQGNDTLIDITDTSATASDVLSGESFYLASGAKATGTLLPAFVVTLSWDDEFGDDGGWVPDCTFAEVQAAYEAGRGITCNLDNSDPDHYPISASITPEGYEGELYDLMFAVYWADFSEDFDSLLDGYFWELVDDEPAYYLESRDPYIFPNFDSPTRTYTPSAQQQTDTITYDPNDGYNGIEQVEVTVEAVSLQAKTRTISAAGTFTDTPDSGYAGLSSVQTTVPEANPFLNLTNIGFFTDGAQRKWKISPHLEVISAEGDTPGFLADLASKTGNPNEYNAVPANTSVSPTESAQTIGGANYMMEGAVTVNAIPSSYVGSGVTRRGSSDMTASNLSVTAPAGYYASAGTKTLSDQNLLAENIKKDISIFGVTGSYEGGGAPELHVDTKDVTPASASSSISFANLAGEPTSFSVVCRGDLSTGSPYKVAAVAFDGSSTIGQYITNTSNAQMTYDGSSFSHSYSNGTLTITCSGANFQAAEYMLCYTYGGGTIASEQVQVGSGVTSITFPNISDEPEAWTCIFTSNIGTSSGYTRAHVVAYDGASIYGMEMGSGSQATAHWSASFSNGSLTISSQSTTQGGYFHQPGYYELVYAIGGGNYQSKTVTPTTSQQVVSADSGYDALKRVTVEPIPGQYIIPTGNIAITSNTSGSQTLDISQYATATVNVPTSGGGATVATKSVTASNRPSSLAFSSLSGQPKMFALKATFTMTSSSSTYYYVDSMRGYLENNAYSVQGRLFQMGSTRQTMHVTSGYSASWSGNTLTLTSTGTRTASPGCFYNGSYELVYVY